MLKPITIKNLSIIYPNKICFEDFSIQIPYGSKIAIVGDNGVGKTSLLSFIAKTIKDYNILYIPQSHNHNDLSGGESFMLHFKEYFTKQPNIIILDEPTNHLDQENLSLLYKILQNFKGTLIFVSHDIDFIEQFTSNI